MPHLHPELLEEVRQIRDDILAKVEDKSDPRYLALVEKIRKREGDRGVTESSPTQERPQP